MEMLNTMSVVLAHLADPLTANDLIPSVNIFLPVRIINHGAQEATIVGLSACTCRCADLGDSLVGQPCSGVIPGLMRCKDALILTVFVVFVSYLLRSCPAETWFALVGCID
jgi:hypothetical protein